MPDKPQILPHIYDVPVYVPGAHGDGMDALILSANENPHGCSPHAKASLILAQEQLHRYPSGYPQPLHDAIAERHGLPEKNLILTAGSDELITLITRAFLQKNDQIIMSQYGFLMYDISARLCGATAVKAPETNYKTDIKAVIDAITPETKVIFLANPNNPTGSYLTNDEMAKLHAQIPPHIMLVIDEAYGEYMDGTSDQAAFQQFKGANNVIVTRTFSKIYGLAGLRLGWGYGPIEVINALHRIRSPFNTSLTAQMAGLEAIKDQNFIKFSIKENQKNRNDLSQALKQMGHNRGWMLTPSHTNFILLHLPDAKIAKDLDGYLRQNHIYVRAMSAYDLPQSLRITIGTKEENIRLIKTLQAYEGPS